MTTSFIPGQRIEAPDELRALRHVAEVWPRYAEEELSIYDSPCESEDESDMCPKCKNVGCIRVKIEQTRAAIRAGQ